MDNAVKIQLPIAVSYSALEGVLKQQMVGEYIPPPEEGTADNPYARILDIRIEGGAAGTFDVVLGIRIRILRTVLKRDEAYLIVQANLGYDNAAQQLYVRQFKLHSKTTSMFFNSGMEVLANKVAYSQILKRAKVNLREIIAVELGKANTLLAEGFELKEAAKVLGKVEMVQVQDIRLQPDRVSLVLEVQANLNAEVYDMVSLMPPKESQPLS